MSVIYLFFTVSNDLTIVSHSFFESKDFLRKQKNLIGRCLNLQRLCVVILKKSTFWTVYDQLCLNDVAT